MLSSTPFLLALLSSSVYGQVTGNVPAGTRYVGIWPDISSVVGDTPAAINERLGYNSPVFQFGQSIPLPLYDYVTGAGGEAQFSTVDATNTDAAYYLTVYPDSGLTNVMDSVIVSLAYQILGYQEKARTVFLRWAPEMQGTWNPGWALMPTLYRQVWIRMHTIIKQIAPETIIVWSPNSSYGYPSGATLADVVSPADQALLDTNGDGQLTSADDAYAPYYPGAEYVDWNGLSMYYKGPGFQNLNEPQPGGFCSSLLDGIDPFYSTLYTPFYSTYCSGTTDCMISESGAAYHENITTGASRLDIQRAWWQDCITNTTFLDLFPNIKMIQMFEHEKLEFDGGVPDYRDYRITNVTEIAQAFAADLAAMADNWTWATPLTTGEVATTAPASPVGTATTTVVQPITGLSGLVPVNSITFTYTAYSSPTVSGEAAAATALSTGPAASIRGSNPILAAAQGDARSSATSITSMSSGLIAFALLASTLL